MAKLPTKVKAEPVRETVTKAVAKHRDPEGDALRHSVIGLARIPKGKQFRCGDCEHFEDGVCHKDMPDLEGTEVDAETECCNWFDCEGMERLL